MKINHLRAIYLISMLFITHRHIFVVIKECQVFVMTFVHLSFFHAPSHVVLANTP